ncbi:MAG: hypothetical protein HZB56_07865 [Deltaproteobacteria bacterium]|nr:hypothetical protein [Deltaproteobacteria bacterium]
MSRLAAKVVVAVDATFGPEAAAAALRWLEGLPAEQQRPRRRPQLRNVSPPEPKP